MRASVRLPHKPTERDRTQNTCAQGPLLEAPAFGRDPRPTLAESVKRETGVWFRPGLEGHFHLDPTGPICVDGHRGSSTAMISTTSMFASGRERGPLSDGGRSACDRCALDDLRGQDVLGVQGFDPVGRRLAVALVSDRPRSAGSRPRAIGVVPATSIGRPAWVCAAVLSYLLINPSDMFEQVQVN